MRKTIIYGCLALYCLYGTVAWSQPISQNSSNAVVNDAEECIGESDIDRSHKRLTKQTVQSWKQELFQKGNVYPDLSAFISVAEVKQKLVSDNAVLIDVRSSEQFSALRIPNSINIQINQLARKVFFKQKTLVLIDTGFSVSSLQTLMMQLKKAGFDNTWALSGGLNAWQYAGEKLIRTTVKQENLNRISAQDLYKDRLFHDVTVLIISDVKAITKKKLEQLLNKHTDSTKGEKVRFVITNDHGKEYEHIESIVAKLKWPQVYFLQGGTPAYTTFMNSQWAIWNRSDKKHGQVSKCGRRKR